MDFHTIFWSHPVISTVRLEPSPIPLHHQIATYLLSQLRTGALQAEERLPPEETLARQFGVSRSTIRQALGSLASEGLVIRRRGVGTFLTPKAQDMVPKKLTGFSWNVFLGAKRVSVRVLEKETVEVPEAVAPLLELKPGAKVVRFKRVRRAEGKPFSFVINYLRPEVGELVSPDWLKSKTMFQVLREELDLALGRVRQTVEVGRADAETAEALEVAVSDPTLDVATTLWLEDKTPVEWVITHFREDRYRYSVDFDRVS
jgi:GntR family transcriptional regulator